MESVDASLLARSRNTVPLADGRPKVIPSLEAEADLLKAFKRFLKTQQSIGVAPPVMIFVSLLGVRDYFLGDSPHPFERDELIFPGVAVDSFNADGGTVLKSTFDILWNSAGYERCLDYKETGELAIDSSWLSD